MDQLLNARSVQINGPALRALRERAGISCTRLAGLAGVDVSFLARVERGEKRGLGGAAFGRIVEELELSDGRALLVDPYGVRDTPVRPRREPVATSRLACGRPTA